MQGAKRVAALCGAVLAVCAALGALPAASRAEGVSTMTAVEQEHLAELTEWAYRNGATATAPDCGAVCTDLWLSEHRPMPNQPASDELWGELNALESSSVADDGVALLPELADFASFISPYSLAIELAPSAYELGWHIGGQIDKWIGIDVPAQPTEVEAQDLQWFPRGSTDPFPTYQDTMAMPFDGFAVMSSDLAGIVAQEIDGDILCDYPGPTGFPAGFVVLRWHWNECRNEIESPPYPVFAYGLVAGPATLMPGPVQDYDGQPSDATTEGLEDPGAETVERRLRTALESGRYPHLNEWIDHILGGGSSNPLCEPVTGATSVRIPSIMPGQTVAGYEDCLDALGLREHVTVTVPVEQAVLAQPARGVVGVEPAEGTSVRVAAETQVTIERNPDPLPDPSELGDPEGECEPSSGEYPVAAPPNDPSPEPFDVIEDESLVERPTFVSQKGTTVVRWGEVLGEAGFRGWGYQHIKAKHGWSRVDEDATRAALLTSAFPNRKQPESWDFIGPAYTQGRTLCTREVIVNFGVQGEEPQARGIVTSYGRPVEELPAVMRPSE